MSHKLLKLKEFFGVPEETIFCIQFSDAENIMMFIFKEKLYEIIPYKGAVGDVELSKRSLNDITDALFIGSDNSFIPNLGEQYHYPANHTGELTKETVHSVKSIDIFNIAKELCYLTKENAQFWGSPKLRMIKYIAAITCSEHQERSFIPRLNEIYWTVNFGNYAPTSAQNTLTMTDIFCIENQLCFHNQSDATKIGIDRAKNILTAFKEKFGLEGF